MGLLECIAYCVPRLKGFSMDKSGNNREKMRRNRERLGKRI
jgi:hypothetical protein